MTKREIENNELYSPLLLPLPITHCLHQKHFSTFALMGLKSMCSCVACYHASVTEMMYLANENNYGEVTYRYISTPPIKTTRDAASDVSVFWRFSVISVN